MTNLFCRTAGVDRSSKFVCIVRACVILLTLTLKIVHTHIFENLYSGASNKIKIARISAGINVVLTCVKTLAVTTSRNKKKIPIQSGGKNFAHF